MGILDGKVAIVTGASQSVGRAEAIALAREGAAVTLVARSYDKLVQVGKEIEAFGGRALPVQCDVCDKQQILAAVEATVEKFGTVDILVNNAQITNFAVVPMEDWSDEDYHRVVDSGPTATWHFMRACFPYMKANGGGKVINTGSGAQRAAMQGYSGYGTAKGAIWALTRNAAMDWAQHNILVNMITPAAAGPAMFEQHTQEEIDAFGKMNPLGRIGDAEQDIAPVVVFLASPASDYMTANYLSCDGGFSPL